MERYEKSVIRSMDRQITKKFSKKKFYKVHLQESLLESINNYGLLIFQLQKSVSCPSRRHFSRLSMRGNSLRSSRPANSMDQDSFDSFDDIEEMVMATTSMSIGHNGHSDANRFVKILKIVYFKVEFLRQNSENIFWTELKKFIKYLNFHGKNGKISKLLSHKVDEFWREKHLKTFFFLFLETH